MKKTVIIMASAIIFLVVIALLLSSLLETRTCYAMGRFKWVPSTNFWDGAYSDIAITEKLGKQFRAMDDFLNSRESRLSLAAKCKADEKHFRFGGVHPIRGTKLLYVEYSGTDSNSVLCVASNAATMVVAFYSTNQPSWEVTYIGSRYFTPRSFWENVWINLENSSWWPF